MYTPCPCPCFISVPQTITATLDTANDYAVTQGQIEVNLGEAVRLIVVNNTPYELNYEVTGNAPRPNNYIQFWYKDKKIPPYQTISTWLRYIEGTPRAYFTGIISWPEGVERRCSSKDNVCGQLTLTRG